MGPHLTFLMEWELVMEGWFVCCLVCVLRFDCGETVGEISGERLFSWGQKVDCQY